MINISRLGLKKGMGGTGLLRSYYRSVQFVVEGVTNLVNPAWQSPSTATLGGRRVDFGYPEWTNALNRFHRFRPP